MIGFSRITIILFLVSCFGGAEAPVKKETSTISCNPQKMRTQEDCVGEDSTFAECRFFFRAYGVPDTQWCMQLKKQASHKQSIPECNFEEPQQWAKVSCLDYQFDGALDCYACNIAQMESNRSYVYAYNDDCSSGIEQVTCNTDPQKIELFRTDKQLQTVR